MSQTAFRLMTASEAEEELGSKYFYRQRTYRYHKSGQLKSFNFKGKQCFLPHMLIKAYISDLEQKLKTQFPELTGYTVLYDEQTRRVMIDGVFNRYVAVNTDAENEEDLITKLRTVLEWMQDEQNMTVPKTPEAPSTSVVTAEVVSEAEPEPAVSMFTPVVTEQHNNDLSDVTGFSTEPRVNDPSNEIKFVRLDTGVVDGVNVKSYILLSLPSIAKFIGVRSDHMSEWVQSTSFGDFVVSIHPSKLGGPGIPGPFRKGFFKGETPHLPLELIPEVLVAFRQSGRTPAYPARAEQLYLLAKSTLEAVGMSIAGSTGQAAASLAKVSESLGISAADQVIEIFKRYESRPFQVDTSRHFAAKVKKEGRDISVVTGAITLGVTGRYPAAWKALGIAKKLPSKDRSSGREVMRTLEPSSSVGVTFSESHYLKDSSNMNEVIETGKKGKEFYERLKSVGLLDDTDPSGV